MARKLYGVCHVDLGGCLRFSRHGFSALGRPGRDACVGVGVDAGAKRTSHASRCTLLFWTRAGLQAGYATTASERRGAKPSPTPSMPNEGAAMTPQYFYALGRQLEDVRD